MSLANRSDVDIQEAGLSQTDQFRSSLIYHRDSMRKSAREEQEK